MLAMSGFLTVRDLTPGARVEVLSSHFNYQWVAAEVLLLLPDQPRPPTDAGEQLVDTLVRVRVLTGAIFVVDYLSLRRWVPPPATPGCAGMLRPSRDLPPYRGVPRKEGGRVKRL